MDRSRQRLKGMIFLGAALFLWGLLFFPGKGIGEEIDPAMVEQGKEYVWEWYECQSCHQINGQGGTLGPSLSGVFQRRSAEFIRSQLENPKQNNPTSQMPEFGLSKEEIKAVMEYLRSLDGET